MNQASKNLFACSGSNLLRKIDQWKQLKDFQINATDSDGKTALFHCSTPDKASALIKCGIDVNITDKNGENALFNQNASILKRLVMHEININQINKNGENAAFNVCASGIDILFKKGINKDLVCNAGHSCVFNAIYSDLHYAVSGLSKPANLHWQYRNLLPKILLKSVKKVILTGIDIEAIEQDMQTLLNSQIAYDGTLKDRVAELAIIVAKSSKILLSEKINGNALPPNIIRI